ncbi:MAG: DUF4287 domain-containing protein [Bryobacteraceae bacterium]
MAKMFQQTRVGTLTDDAVTARTGKTWEEWFKLLDKAGARMMDHQEISATLQKQFGLSRWWGQMVAVGYENERGIRQDGRGDAAGKRYEVTLNKIVLAPRAAVWDAWHDPGMLARWLPGASFEVSSAVPQKTLRLAWPGDTSVTVRFYERRGRARIVVAHAKLSEDNVERMQRYWSDALDRLRVLMAG